MKKFLLTIGVASFFVLVLTFQASALFENSAYISSSGIYIRNQLVLDDNFTGYENGIVEKYEYPLINYHNIHYIPLSDELCDFIGFDVSLGDIVDGKPSSVKIKVISPKTDTLNPALISEETTEPPQRLIAEPDFFDVTVEFETATGIRIYESKTENPADGYYSYYHYPMMYYNDTVYLPLTYEVVYSCLNFSYTWGYYVFSLEIPEAIKEDTSVLLVSSRIKKTLKRDFPNLDYEWYGTDREYPTLEYKQVIYLPLSYDFCRLLSLEYTFEEKNGEKFFSLSKSNHNSDDIKTNNSYYGGNWEHIATLPDYRIFLEGKEYDNKNAEHPFVNYKGVTYLPLTWDIANTFGWNYRYTEEYSFDGVEYTYNTDNGLILDVK